jgi:hypothetical protein
LCEIGRRTTNKKMNESVKHWLTRMDLSKKENQHMTLDIDLLEKIIIADLDRMKNPTKEFAKEVKVPLEELRVSASKTVEGMTKFLETLKKRLESNPVQYVLFLNFLNIRGEMNYLVLTDFEDSPKSLDCFLERTHDMTMSQLKEFWGCTDKL